MPASPAGAPRIAGLHVGFGADAAGEIVVSWHTYAPVRDPHVRYGTMSTGLDDSVAAQTVSYTDAYSGTQVYAHHARITDLAPDTEYLYAAVHDGATPEPGTVRTAPRGRAPLRFTSFGDQSTPMVNALLERYASDSNGSPAAGDITAAVERARPLFHLVNGDLSYANLSCDRIRTWSDWFENNTRSARHRPWMPAAGNHENERGNGPFGYRAYQTYFALPDNGAPDGMRGLWYAFTAGSVRVISLNNDDICYQDAGNTYIRDYSGGAQQRWLAAELERTSRDPGIDWIVVCMHQVAMSTGADTNGADLGIRENWLPLFDRYGVDLVVCGHEHHYERSHPVRGTLGTGTLTPRPAATDPDLIDTSTGTVHLVLGAGGTAIPSHRRFFPDARCRVLVGVGDTDPVSGHRTPRYVEEPAPWLAFRDTENPCGFGVFDVDPGPPDGPTTITATYLAVDGPAGDTRVVDRFVLTRPRRG